MVDLSWGLRPRELRARRLDWLDGALPVQEVLAPLPKGSFRAGQLRRAVATI